MSQFTTPSYEIPRTSGVCAATGQPLQPGQRYYAALVELSPEEMDAAKKESAAAAAASLGLRRLDVSAEAWEGGEGGFRPERLYSYWKSTVPEPNAKKKLFVDDGVLMNLLRRLEDATQPERLAFRYVLALILMRKKLVRYDGSTKKPATVDGKEVQQTWWLLTPKLDLSKGPMGKWNEEDQFLVLDPGLDDSQVEQVTTQLSEILETEL